METPIDQVWTVGRLIEQLKLQDPDEEVIIGSHFTIYRVKDRTGVCQIEINEVEGEDYILLEDEEPK